MLHTLLELCVVKIVFIILVEFLQPLLLKVTRSLLRPLHGIFIFTVAGPNGFTAASHLVDGLRSLLEAGYEIMIRKETADQTAHDCVQSCINHVLDALAFVIQIGLGWRVR
jgi:hypothetical protein